MTHRGCQEACLFVWSESALPVENSLSESLSVSEFLCDAAAPRVHLCEVLGPGHDRPPPPRLTVGKGPCPWLDACRSNWTVAVGVCGPGVRPCPSQAAVFLSEGEWVPFSPETL